MGGEAGGVIRIVTFLQQLFVWSTGFLLVPDSTPTVIRSVFTTGSNLPIAIVRPGTFCAHCFIRRNVAKCETTSSKICEILAW